MAYTALYRKWRPTRFEDVKGQDHIVKTLKNQINADRIGHAYLFCGTRGTGKTTVAKIFAKAVNCENPIDGSPCNECETCKAINSQASINVVEIDAASNNGVENIREIRDEVRYSPTEGRFRVYIIDEVHMLSTGAFNALLKTLEEPPSYVIFILATTEVHKIPITVLSRCQRYDFKRMNNETISRQIEHLLIEENIEAESAAIRYIAKAADGSMRDALSLLEQCISFYYGQKLTYENVLDVLGAVDTEVFSALLRSVLNKDVAKTIALVDEIIEKGRDLSQFVSDFTWYMRNLMLVQTSDQSEEALDISSENFALLKEESHMLDSDTLMRYIRVFSELSGKIKYVASKRVMVEIALMKLMKPAMEDDIDSLKQRLLDLEQALEGKDLGMIVRRNVEEQKREEANSKEAANNTFTGPVTETVEVTKAEYEDYQLLVKEWPKIVSLQDKLICRLLQGTSITYDNERKSFCILFQDSWAQYMMGIQDRMNDLNKWIEVHYQKKVQLTIRELRQNEKKVEVIAGNKIPGIEMEIGIEPGC